MPTSGIASNMAAHSIHEVSLAGTIEPIVKLVERIGHLSRLRWRLDL